MVEVVALQVLVNLLFAGGFAVIHRRTRRMQALMNAHLHSDHEHLQVTEELTQRVADLDGNGLLEALRKETDDE